MVSFFEYAKASAFTPPDWRYERAHELFQEGHKDSASAEDDLATRQCLRYLHWRSGRTECRWDSNLKSLRTADALYHRHAHETLRLELECRFLSGLPDRKIAQTTTIPKDVVTAYRRTFFDIRERLESEPYIHAIVLKTAPFESYADEDGILRYLSYVGGPSMIEPLMLVYRASIPALHRGLAGELGERIVNSSYLECLFSRGGLQPVHSRISDLLKILGIHIEKYFDLEVSIPKVRPAWTIENCVGTRKVG